MRKSLLKQLTWEDIKEIVETALSTPFNGPTPEDDCYKEILRILRNENEVPPPIEERFPFILSCAELACGQALDESRDKDNTLIRCFVAYRLHKDGYSYSEIGKMMKRDHSTITHLSHRMRDMLSIPYAYKSEVAKYKEFEQNCG